MRTVNYKTMTYKNKKINIIYEDLLESFKGIKLQGTKPNKNWYSRLSKYQNLWNFSEVRFITISSIFKLLSIIVLLFWFAKIRVCRAYTYIYICICYIYILYILYIYYICIIYIIYIIHYILYICLLIFLDPPSYSSFAFVLFAVPCPHSVSFWKSLFFVSLIWCGVSISHMN